MSRGEILKRYEYERIQGLANAIASMSKRGAAQYETLVMNDHIDFLNEIERMVNDIRTTVV